MYSKEQLSKILLILTSSIFIILIIALFNLQIVNYNKYKITADNNFLRIKTVYPVRGEILDRNFDSISSNKSSYNLYIIPGKIREKYKVISFVISNFSIDSLTVSETIHKNRFRLFQEILLVQNIQYKDVVHASEQLNYFPSLVFRNEAVRSYRYPNHFNGYLGRIDEKEYKNLKNEGYSINSLIGKTGLEKHYESILRGENGYEVIQVDASGKDLEFFKHNLNQPCQNGADLVLTIDNRLQTYAQKIFPDNENGAIIVLDKETGGILTYVSKPDFDLNIFSNNISAKQWKKLMNDPDKPMLDRAISGTYPPASIYKTLIATLGLEENLINPETKLTECSGGMYFGERYFKCWWEEGHGKLDLIDAIKHSCDVYFYDLSTRFSLELLEQYSHKWHLGEKTGIDLPNERKGFFPTKKWYVDNYGKYVGIKGQKVNLSIGQGEILLTPIQLCAYYNALANKGTWLQPHFLLKTISENETKIVQPRSLKIEVSTQTMEIIGNALYKVVNSAYGTGGAARVREIKVYGKTGSAENHMGDETHAWFAGYTESDNPDITFLVFIENIGHGGSEAAPIAKKLIQYYQKL